METAHFDYELPEASIAQHPVEPRHSARMLVDAGAGARPLDRTVADLPDLIRPGDVVVVNDTRVLPARLALTKPSGGSVEVFLLEEVAAGEWHALVRPSRRVPVGMVFEPGPDLSIEVGEVVDEGVRAVKVSTDDLAASLDRHGTVPLPPYITADLADPGRYQTVYAREPGSVAAPTAGLHLTAEVIAAMESRGATIVDVELLVGLGTFKPITADRIDDHRMHEERYRVPQETWDACRAADRVIAVGTTTVRALESASATGRLQGRTDLYLRPGSDFGIVDLLMTNFHQPRSSLLVLVEAFAGPHWRDLYAHALGAGYRFLSFGDCMVLGRAGRGAA